MRRTTEEWEQDLGAQLRRVRLDAGLDQRQLADLANLSVNAIHRLEQGKGSTTRTLIRAARALHQEDWLSALSPETTVSPLRMLTAATEPRQRVSRPRT